MSDPSKSPNETSLSAPFNNDDDGEETRGAGAKALDKVGAVARVTRQRKMDCNEKIIFRSKREDGSRYVAAV